MSDDEEKIELGNKAMKNCKLKHMQNWLNLFEYQHNREISQS